MKKADNEATGQAIVLNVAWVAHPGAGSETGDKAAVFMLKLLPPWNFRMTSQQPDIILFMSGGSERMAISLAEPGTPVLLLSIRGNNAYAAAAEVMAWMVNNNRYALLSDAMDAFESGLVDKWCYVVGAWRSLRGKKAGLIGSVSEWLVASEVSAEILAHQFGITLEVFPWNALPDYSEMDPDTELISSIRGKNVNGLVNASRVLTLLRQVIFINNLSAIAVECFSLVQQRKVTACLALAQLNAEGWVAACEGDLASMAGMMLLEAVTGSSTWMANTTRITKNSLILSHCTIAFDLVKHAKLKTHYETDCSLAVKGVLDASEVTVFRFSDTLDRAFIAEGTVIGHPEMTNACRTQVEIELPELSLRLLETRPLGNHLVLAPGKLAELLRLVCLYKGIKIIE
jgi:L-fucose isomerase-like protein